MQLAVVRQCIQKNQYKSQRDIGKKIFPFRWVGSYLSLQNVLVTTFNTDGLLWILNYLTLKIAAACSITKFWVQE
jgi:hypothetical protein